MESDQCAGEWASKLTLMRLQKDEFRARLSQRKRHTQEQPTEQPMEQPQCHTQEEETQQTHEQHEHARKRTHTRKRTQAEGEGGAHRSTHTKASLTTRTITPTSG